MSEIVNLRRARKVKVRATAAEDAATNRARFGLSRAEREAFERARLSEARKLDGHLRARDPDVPPVDDGTR